MSVRNPITYEELLELTRSPGFLTSWDINCTLSIAEVPHDVLNTGGIMATRMFGETYYGNMFLVIDVDSVVHQRMVNHKDHLTVEITRRQITEEGIDAGDHLTFSQTFDAKLTDATNPDIMALTAATHGNSVTQQLTQPRKIALQLIEPFLSDYRLVSTGGVYRDVTMKEILQVVLGVNMGKVPDAAMLSSREYPGLRGVDVTEPDNTTRYSHLLIPPMKLVEIPKFLQEKAGGVYSSGLGWHVYRGICYVYPRLKTTGFQEQPRTLTVLNIPTGEIPTLEKTFLVRSNQVFVFSTGSTGHADESEGVLSNVGNGIRYSPASHLLDSFRTVSENKAWCIRKDNVKEFIVKERPDGRNNIRDIPGNFTDNPYPLLSELTLGLGSVIRLNWDHAAPQLVYPGMQVRILYKKGEHIVQRYGSLMGIVEVEVSATETLLDNHYTNTCSLIVRVAEEEITA